MRFAALVLMVLGAVANTGGQSGLWTAAAINFPIQATVTRSNCTAPAAGVTNLCTTGTEGMLISCNGAAYIAGVSCTASSAGVASISVNGGLPLTGPVALTIPSKAVSTATAPNASFATNGALTLTAPVVTTTIQ